MCDDDPRPDPDEHYNDSPPFEPLTEEDAQAVLKKAQEMKEDIISLLLRMEDEETELDSEMWMGITDSLKLIIGADPRKLMKDQCDR